MAPEEKFCKLEDLFVHCNEPENQDCILNIDLKKAPTELLEVDKELNEVKVQDLFRLKLRLVYLLMKKHRMEHRVFWVSPSSWEHSQLLVSPYVEVSRCMNAS